MNLKSIVTPVHVEDELGLLVESELVCACWWVHLVAEVSVPVSAHVGVLGGGSLWNKDEWSIDVESELLVDALSWLLACLVKINNLPFLVESLVWWVDNYVLALLVLSSVNIEYLVVDDVLELSCARSIFEDLEPVVVLGATSLEVLSSTSRLDLEWLVVLFTLDSSSLPVEVEDLSGLSIGGLDGGVLTEHGKLSSHWKSRNDIEVPLDEHAVDAGEVTLLEWLWCFVLIDQIPLLAHDVLALGGLYSVVVDLVSVSARLDDLSFTVDDVLALSVEVLPPSGGWSLIENVGTSAAGLNTHGSASVGHISNGL